MRLSYNDQGLFKLTNGQVIFGRVVSVQGDIYLVQGEYLPENGWLWQFEEKDLLPVDFTINFLRYTDGFS